jgi:hypothetical protein
MDDEEVLTHISRLVGEENKLRTGAKSGGLDDAAHERMRQLEVQLDQCWDLLRRRQAREEFGQDPNLEREQPPSVVENYRQ